MSTMPYEVQIEAQDTHITVNVSGTRTPGHEVEDSVSTWRRVTDACRNIVADARDWLLN